MTATVDILLATYNGARHLPELLASLESQSHSNWRLLVRDDGSQDLTEDILEDFRRRHGDRVRRIVNAGENLGSCRNFFHLLEHSTADYIMFCDQDDVWLPDKVAHTMNKMQGLEKQYGIETPLLVHTNFRVVDGELHLIAESGHRYQHIDPYHGAGLSRLLLQNIVTGCTMMINRPLRTLAPGVPTAALMHDHWLALVAATFGRIGYVADPTLLYRQHTANAVGAQQWNSAYMWQLAGQLPKIRMALARNRLQAEAFYQRYSTTLCAEKRTLLEAFVSLPRKNWLVRRVSIVRHHFYYCGPARNVGWLILC